MTIGVLSRSVPTLTTTADGWMAKYFLSRVGDVAAAGAGRNANTAPAATNRFATRPDGLPLLFVDKTFL